MCARVHLCMCACNDTSLGGASGRGITHHGIHGCAQDSFQQAPCREPATMCLLRSLRVARVSAIVAQTSRLCIRTLVWLNRYMKHGTSSWPLSSEWRRHNHCQQQGCPFSSRNVDLEVGELRIQTTSTTWESAILKMCIRSIRNNRYSLSTREILTPNLHVCQGRFCLADV